MNTPLNVMILSSDLETRRRLKEVLGTNAIDAICSSSIHDCREVVAEDTVNLVFCDTSLADGSYRDLLRTPGFEDGRIKVVVTSRMAGWDEFLEAMRLGAFDMIATPCVPTEVEWVISQAVRAGRSERHAAGLDSGTPEIRPHFGPRPS